MQGDQKAIDVRFDKTRARNRAAQLRFRQRLQDECETLERQVCSAEANVTAARERYVALQRQKVSLSTRTANAVAAYAAIRAQQPAPPAPAAPSSGIAPAPPTESATYVAARACLDRSTATPPGQSHPRGHASEPANWGRPAAPNPSSTLIQSSRGARALRQPLVQPPRRIASFRASAGISYNDMRAAADTASPVIDLTRHSIGELTDRVFTRKAALLQLPRGDVCWFVQTLYEVAEGLPLSVSTSTSSPECLASIVLHYVISRLESMLITAAAELEDSGQFDGGGAEQERNGLLARDGAIVTEEIPRQKVPRAHPAPGSAAARMHVGASAIHAPPPMHDAVQREVHAHAPSSAPAARSAPEQGDRAWSGCVRVGVGELHDAGAAARAIVRDLLRRFCRQIPLATIYRLLSSYHAVLVRIQSGFSAARWKAGGSAVPPSADTRVGEDVREFMARAMAGGRGAVKAFADALDAFSDMNVLRQLEAEGPAPSPLSDECSPEHNIEAYAHVAVTISATLQILSLRATPRLVMNVSFYGTHALARLDDEIDSFHVNLYRQLKLTEEDRARLVAHLKNWRQLSTTLNTPFHSALSTLSSLPQAGDIPAALVANIADVAAGGLHLHDVLTHEPHAFAAVEVDSGSEAGSTEDGESDEDELRLLGACATATAAAERGLLELREVHETHGRVRRETKELQMQPGVLLRPLQLARMWSAHIFHSAAQADTIQICQLATSQQRWRDLASLSQVLVLQQPPPKLPQYQWFEGPATEGSTVGQDGARVKVLG